MRITLASGKILECGKDETLLEAFKRQGVSIVASCGGKGVCGKCRVRVTQGAYHAVSTGKLGKEDLGSGITLACQTVPQSDVTVDIPKESMLTVGDILERSRVDDLREWFRASGETISPLITWIRLAVKPPSLDDNIGDLERVKKALESIGMGSMAFHYSSVASLATTLRESGWDIYIGCAPGREAIFVSPSARPKRYGLAVDIGTTTVVVYFVDVEDGSIVDVGSTYNSQMRFGDDVITRIVYAAESNGLYELQEMVVSDVNDLIANISETHAIDEDEIESVVVAGNTTMSHLFWGLNPAFIREEPYTPTANFFPIWQAEIVGIKTSKRAPVYTVPCVASYVGGDIVAGVLASRMHTEEKLSLFMDIGTNGEIVIGNREWLVTAACSAGPCFEGSGIRHGMRATEGAIAALTIDPQTFEPAFRVIGDSRPMGICGSGMIDAITELFLAGVIDRRGRFNEELASVRIRKGDEGHEFLIAEGNGRDIVLTEVDIENILRAKAAIYAGVSLLLRKVGLPLDAIERIYIAGGFGNYLDIDKAIVIGMLPDVPREKFRFLGNSAIAGAYLCLISEKMRGEAEAIARMMTNVELSTSRRFMDEYLSALFIPHTDLGLFPTAEAAMRARGLR